jgi:hypothetical protein
MKSNKSQFKEFSQIRKELEKEMINGILEYVKEGIFPNNSPNSYINVYTYVQTYSDESNEKCEELFNYQNKILKEFIEDCQKKIKKLSNIQFIDAFLKKTENINFLIYWINRIFTYLDRFYMISTKKNSLYKNAQNLYKDYFFDHLQSKVHKEINNLIKEDRKYNLEFRPKIKAVLKIINDLDLIFPKIIKENNKLVWVAEKGTENEKNDYIYGTKWYNDSFEKETKQFSEEKAKNDIHNMSAPEYITSQLKYLDEEKIRQKEFINKIFHKKIDQINYTNLIWSNAQELGKMDTGIPYMFKNRKNEELKKAYQLFKLFPESLKVITEAFIPYIKQRGEEITENKEISKDPKKFIPELIKLKLEMDNLVEECFEKDNSFQDTKNKGFSNFMNKSFYAKQLSNYTDYCLRVGFKGKSEPEVENTLNEIIGLFKCINTKLVFSIDANSKMSDRLIKNKTISLNYEKKLISKLKQEQGVNYVGKMTQMMNDLDKNRNEIDVYCQLPHKGKPNGIKFNIQIISESAWEINKNLMEKIEMPKFLSFCKDDFETYYKERHANQKIMWCLGLSKLDIQYLCFKNKNISTSTLPQYLILYWLEKYEKLTISRIAELLGCQKKTILTDITGLVYNPTFNPQGVKEKGLILGTFNDQKKEFKENDEIYFNKNFSCSRQKFQTMQLPIKKTAEEEKEAEIEEAQITKKYQDNILQATLTRIMKSRIGQKTTHVWIVNETSKQIDLFRAQPQQIKENIEKLIEKNIMKRAENDRTCYEYIA